MWVACLRPPFCVVRWSIAHGLTSTDLGISLDELVKDGKNGLVFKDAAQLAEQLEVGTARVLSYAD